MITQVECDILNIILGEYIAPEYKERIQSFECILVRKSFIDADYYISVIVNYYYEREHLDVFPDEAYYKFRMYLTMLGLGFNDYEIRYNCIFDNAGRV